MSDTSQNPDPLSRTLYPFPKLGSGDASQSQAAEASAQDYFKALAEAEDGFFPIGYNGQWHGGIHFGGETGKNLAQAEGVRCIADGQVIAYRIDEEYPTVKYASCPAAKYSKGFVLVRHRLQLPPAPRATEGEDTAAASPDAEPSLVFFSLYMHLRNSKAYADDTSLKRPAFWDTSVHVVGERAVDDGRNRDPSIPEAHGTGMNIRDGNHAISGFAPRGVKLKLGEANPSRSAYYRITEVVEGTTYPDDVVGMYVYKGTSSSAEGLDPTSQPHTKDKVYIPPRPVEIKAGDLVGHLGEYQRYMDMEALGRCSTSRPLAQVDVFTHEPLKTFIDLGIARDAELAASQKTLLHIKPDARLVQPSEPDVVLSNGEAVVVTGDDTDGRWIKGRRGTVAIVDEKPSGFSSTTRAYGDGRIFLAAVDADGNELTLEQLNALTNKNTHPRRKLLTPVGEEVWVSSGSANSQSMVTAPANVWSGFPLQVANAGGESVAHSRVVPVGAIEQVVKETDDIRWFQVQAGTSSSGEVSGWVRESGHANVELCSPWAWPGFELFDVGELEPRELFARELANSRRAQPQEQKEFQGAARNIEESPLFDALGKAIDADGNQQVTPLELRSAMNTQWLAQAISRLVIRYPSEWSDPTNRWSRIDELIEDEMLRKDWEHEKGRIRELVIWPDIAKQHDFPPDSAVHHFHPVGFIENFVSSNKYDCLTYRILHKNGLLERITPENITPKKANLVRYIYLDAAGNEHDLGEYEFISAQRVGPGNSPTAGTARLIDLRDIEDYSSGSVKYGFYYDTRLTLRPYIADHAMASLFGAMLDVGYEDISCNGFSDHRGHSIGGSSSHRNGENGDFKYLRADGVMQTRGSLHINETPELMDESRQNEFNGALRKYGWTDLLAWRYEIDGKPRLLDYTRHYVNHEHHLHLQGYSPQIRELNE